MAATRTAAARVRRHRERQKAGLVCLRVEVDEHAVASVLVALGLVTSDDAVRRRDLERGVAELVARVAMRWETETR